jgi:hypothetical protein
MDLILTVRGASAEEKQRGVEAAKAVIEREGITAKEAAYGVFALEGWDDMGFPEDREPSEAEYAAADVWYKAEEAALEACCANWPDRKPHTGLELRTDPETQLADRDTALAKLRAIIKAEDGRGEHRDDRVFLLGRCVVAEMEDENLAQELVNELTIAYTPLSLAGVMPD